VTLCHHHGGSSGAKGFVGSEGTVSAPWTLQEKRLPGWEPLPWRGLRWTSVGLRFRHTRARRVAGRPGFDGEVIRWVSRGLAEIGARPCRALNPPYGTKKAANRNARRGFPAGPNSRISIYRVNRFVGCCQADFLRGVGKAERARHSNAGHHRDSISALRVGAAP